MTEDMGKDFLDRFVELVKKVGGNDSAARIMGVSVKTVERWKAGAEPSLNGIIRLSRHENVSLEWLATGYGNPTPKGIPALRERDQQAIQDGTFWNKTIEEELAYEKAYAAGRLDPEAVKNAVKMLKTWMDKNNRNISPDEMADAVFLLARAANEDGKIPDSILDSLMKFKGNFPENG